MVAIDAIKVGGVWPGAAAAAAMVVVEVKVKRGRSVGVDGYLLHPFPLPTFFLHLLRFYYF